MKSQALRCRFQHLEAAVGRKRRHGQRPLARRAKHVPRVVARNSNLPFRFFVKRLKVCVADRPIVQRAAFDGPIGGSQPEILLHEAPCHRAVAERPAAHARGIVAVGPMIGLNDVFAARAVGIYARIALVRPERSSQHTGALVAQVVFAIVGRREPLAALQKHNAQPGFGEFFGDDAAPAPLPTTTALTCFRAMAQLAYAFCFLGAFCCRPRIGG